MQTVAITRATNRKNDSLIWNNNKIAILLFEKEAKSIVAGPSFLQYLNKLFQIQTSAGDIIKFESGNTSKYYMLSATGTWDEIIKLQ